MKGTLRRKKNTLAQVHSQESEVGAVGANMHGSLIRPSENYTGKGILTIQAWVRLLPFR